MARRSLSPEEAQLWNQLASTVRPLRRGMTAPTQQPIAVFPQMVVQPLAAKPSPAKVVTRVHSSANTLDASWDKRLTTGQVSPDRTIDLHGHSLASAHAVLEHALGDAIRSGGRVILLITGKPARHNPRMPPTGRGVIRASVMDWIAAGSHSSRIAAVRGAHPRHGGAGALYLILKRDQRGFGY
jgi:DNA-nicking Smr family endonuclease